MCFDNGTLRVKDLKWFCNISAESTRFECILFLLCLSSMRVPGVALGEGDINCHGGVAQEAWEERCESAWECPAHRALLQGHPERRLPVPLL